MAHKMPSWNLKFNLLFIVMVFSQGFSRELEVPEHEKNIYSEQSIKLLLEKIPGQVINEDFRQFLEASFPSRLLASSGHQGAQNFLLKHGSSLQVEDFSWEQSSAIKRLQELRPPHWQAKINYLNTLGSTRGRNFWWEKRGNKHPQEYLLIGTNYDSFAVNNQGKASPQQEALGADNNGTGVIIALQLISLLTQIPLKKSVAVVFFDGEEFGQLGAQAFLQKHLPQIKQERFFLMANLKMLGHDCKRRDHSKRLGNFQLYLPPSGSFPQASSFGKKLQHWGQEYSAELKFYPTHRYLNFGDHLAFLEQQLPALLITQDLENDLNHNLYTGNDFFETLDQKVFHEAFQYVAGGVIAWAMELP